VHRTVAAKAVEAGVLTRPLPIIEVNSFSPPLCMSRSEAEEAVARYSKGLDAPTPDLAKAAAGL
jgi:L-2,4-diaminobutyrate transaminase